jgi:hypothetical protein
VKRKGADLPTRAETKAALDLPRDLESQFSSIPVAVSNHLLLIYNSHFDFNLYLG